MKKMTAAQLETRIRKGLKKHGLKLAHHGYYDTYDGMVCAIGGALAYAAKTKAQLVGMINSFAHNPQDPHAPLPGHRLARISAKILNHKLTPKDMVLLEMGYEAIDYSTMIRFADARDAGSHVAPNAQNPFYKLGKRLREESFKVKKAA